MTDKTIAFIVPTKKDAQALYCYLKNSLLLYNVLDRGNMKNMTLVDKLGNRFIFGTVNRPCFLRGIAVSLYVFHHTNWETNQALKDCVYPIAASSKFCRWVENVDAFDFKQWTKVLYERKND